MNDRTRGGKAGRSAFFRGDDGMRRTDEELERQKQRAEQRKKAGGNPFRFRVPVGETRQIIITDDKPDFFMYEHALKDADGHWGKLFTGCIKAFDNCPVCAANPDKESYYAMVLTVVDLTPFEMRDGTKVDFSRKLLIVKPAQQKKFLRFYNKEGTLRGALFDMTRDGDKDSSIGNDIEFVEFVDEDEMASYHRSWKDKDGKKHSEDCGEPFDYEALFEEPTSEKLRAIVGGGPTPGSREAEERAVGRRRSVATGKAKSRAKDDDFEDDEDDLPFEPDPPKTRGRRGRDEEPEEEAPRRGRKPAKEEEAPRRGRRSAEPEDEPEEEAPRRGRGRREGPVEEEPEPPRRGRGRREEPEEPEEDEDPPPRRGRR